MAPPFKHKFCGGEVFFKNVPREKVEAVRALLDKLEQNHVVEPEQVQPLPAPSGVLTDMALGLHKNSDGHWEIATVKYNPSTKEAKVEETQTVGKDMSIARSEWKMKAVKLNIV